jgi:hypothetical protein
MSVEVEINSLGAALDDYPWGYVVTVSDSSQARLVAVPTRFDDGLLIAPAGPGTLRNATARPEVTMVFPPPAGSGYSLIVDGVAEVVGDTVCVRPTRAVLHRPALNTPG